MKIEINEFENYEINFPPKVNKQEFIMLADRFNKILKMVGKDELTDLSSRGNDDKLIESKRTRSSKRIYANSKEKSVMLHEIQYHGSKEEKKDFAKKFNIDWDKHVGKSLWSLRKRYNISPKEVGLIKFPGQGEQTNRLKLSNYKYKLNMSVFEN